MSGIFGIVHLDGRPVDVSDLERMRHTMAHRGPDGSAIWREGGVGLGQLMLHTTPESLTETLPWKDAESGLVITADARIDNREELAAKLGSFVGARLAGDHANSHSAIPDSQFILAAYKRWGDACVDHLLGDFAFVIWNPRDQRLFCARDHLGVRPFYYHCTDSLFVFASSALGVLSVAAVPNLINEARIADYLVYDLEGADKTCSWFENVFRLPPARIATLTDGGLEVRAYWEPDTETELRLASDNEYTDAFEEVFTTAVRVRMRSPKPVASMLSGGLDSSTIVGIARNLQREGSGSPLITFSGVSDAAEECRETRHSRMVIEQGGVDAHLLHPSDVPRFAERLHRIETITEDAFDMNWIHHRMVYLSARELGCVVVMDGTDGGGVVSLTGTYPSFLIGEGHWGLARREIHGLRKNAYRQAIPLWKAYLEAVRPFLVPQRLRRLRQHFLGTEYDRVAVDYLLNPEFVHKTALAERLRIYREDGNMLSCQNLRQAHVRRLMAAYVTAGIERYGRLAATCGVEARSPILDLRLVNFCISLPWNQKVRNGWLKFGLRRVAERVLPKEVAWRSGWDSILWKFWYAWGDMNEAENRAVLHMNRHLLKGILASEEYTKMFSHFNIGDLKSAERHRSIISGLKWINTVRSNGYI